MPKTNLHRMPVTIHRYFPTRLKSDSYHL